MIVAFLDSMAEIKAEHTLNRHKTADNNINQGNPVSRNPCMWVQATSMPVPII